MSYNWEIYGKLWRFKLSKVNFNDLFVLDKVYSNYLGIYVELSFK